MSPEFRSLLIKEWSERRRTILFGVGFMLVCLGYCIAYEVEYRTRAFVASFYSMYLLFSWLAAVLLAMSTATGEYTQRTLRYSASLPISLKQIAWTRLLGAWGCLIGPMVIGALFVTLLLASGFFEQAGLRPAGYAQTMIRLPDRPSLTKIEAVRFLWTATAIAIMAAIHMVTLISLLGTWCRTEATVGFLGAIVGLIFVSLTTIRFTLESSELFLLSDWFGGLIPGALAICWSYMDLDGSTYTDLELAPLIVGPLVVSSVITMGLGWWFSRRYGCRVDFAVRGASRRIWRFVPSGPHIISRLRFRWPGRFAALAWLNTRQSLPLCLAGLTLAVLITFLNLTDSLTPGITTAQLAGELPNNTWFVGLLWGTIVAVAIFSPELQSGLEHFWRSRPISPAAWFWTKFAVGLVALLGTLDVIPALISSASSYRPRIGRIGVAYAACIPLLHTLTYAIAVAAVCRIRRPIPAAMTALILFFALESILDSVPVHPKLSTMNVYNKLSSTEFDPHDRTGSRTGEVDLTTNGYPLVYGIVAAIILSATVFARRTVNPRIADRIGLGVVWLLCGWYSPNAFSAEPTDVSDLLEGLRTREASVHDLHLRWTWRAFYTGESVRIRDDEEQTITNRRQDPAADPAVPREELHTYEYFDRPPFRAWTEFNADGTVKTTTTFDGTVRREYYGGASLKTHGSVTEHTQPPPPMSKNPESLLTFSQGSSLSELVNTLKPDSIIRREADGERFIDWNAKRTVTGTDDTGYPFSYEHRYQMTINVTRGYWPVRQELEVAESPSGGIISRTVSTAEGWNDGGPIDFPKRVERKTYSKMTDRAEGSDDLVHTATHVCDVELVEINSDIPDSIFTAPYPPGAVYYDFRDRQWYDVDTAGESRKYAPKPRGLRGAVLVYFLICITAAGVYLLRQPSQGSIRSTQSQIT